jgi:mono/diheme cytochrome c family protein
MRGLLLWLAAAPLCAQDALVIRGREIFRTHCSVPYCHGPNGVAGRAPKLAGHNLAARELFDIVSSGIDRTGMPAFQGQLKTDDIEAVVSYVMTLKGEGSAPGVSGANATARLVPPALQSGKALFFDATRLGGCGRCHELEQRGSPVGPDLKTAPRHANLRSIEATHTVTAQPAGEAAFPAFPAVGPGNPLRVFDLSSPLPVLRTFAPDRVSLKPGSTWNHRDAVRGYSDAELRSIAEYLQWVAEN